MSLKLVAKQYNFSKISFSFYCENGNSGVPEVELEGVGPSSCFCLCLHTSTKLPRPLAAKKKINYLSGV